MNMIQILKVAFQNVKENKKTFLLFTAACIPLSLVDALLPLYKDAFPPLIFQLCRMLLNNIVIRSLIFFPFLRAVFPDLKTASGYWKLSAKWLLFYALLELGNLPYRIASHYLMHVFLGRHSRHRL